MISGKHKKHCVVEGVTECACAFARVHAVRVGAWDWRIAGRRLLSSETVAVMQEWGTVAIVLCMRACGRAGRSAGQRRARAAVALLCASDVCRGAEGVGGRRGAGALPAAVGGVARAQGRSAKAA